MNTIKMPISNALVFRKRYFASLEKLSVFEHQEVRFQYSRYIYALHILKAVIYTKYGDPEKR